MDNFLYGKLGEEPSNHNDLLYVHENSGILNLVFCKVAVADRGECHKKIGQIWLKAVETFKPDLDCQSSALLTLKAAKPCGEGLESLIYQARNDLGINLCNIGAAFPIGAQPLQLDFF